MKKSERYVEGELGLQNKPFSKTVNRTQEFF